MQQSNMELVIAYSSTLLSLTNRYWVYSMAPYKHPYCRSRWKMAHHPGVNPQVDAELQRRVHNCLLQGSP